MQQRQKYKLLTRYFLGLASKTEKQELYNLPESQQMMQEQWDEPIADELTESMKNRLQNKVYRKTIHKPTVVRFAPLLRVAAVLLIGLLIGGLFYFNDMFTDKAPEMVRVESPAGQRTQVTLPDGSKLMLAGSSQIEYPETFSNKSREVKLLGQAFFDVVHLDNKTFLVKTSDIIVKVLGTKFSVENYPGDPITQTILLSGKVQVECTSKNKTVDLLPGEQHTYNNISKTGDISRVDASRLTGWIDGKVVFDQENIFTVCKKLERWYGVEIEITNPGNRDDLYTFTIDNNSLEEVLLLMQKVSPMNYTDEENRIKITFAK